MKRLLLLLVLLPGFVSAQTTNAMLTDSINKYIKTPISAPSIKKVFGFTNNLITPVGSMPFIGTTGNQTGLTGNKTTSGLWSFNGPFVNRQASFGGSGQGGLISFKEGGGGTEAFTIGYFNATSPGVLLHSTSSSGLVLRNSGTTGFVGLEATGASGYLNFLSANTQTMRMQNSRVRIGTITTDDPNSTVRIDGVLTSNSARTINVSSAAGTLSITTAAGIYTFTGTTSTWTLPAISTTVGLELVLVNKGSGTITLNSAGANEIYDSGSISSTMPIATTENYTIINDGTHWIVKN